MLLEWLLKKIQDSTEDGVITKLILTIIIFAKPFCSLQYKKIYGVVENALLFLHLNTSEGKEYG